MAELTIQLKCDPVTGKKNIIVSLRSDEDSLPHEHEQMHKQLVDRLVEGGLLSADEVGELIIEREEEAPESSATATASEQPQRESAAEGS